MFVSTQENLVTPCVLVFDKERVTPYRDVEFLPMNVTFDGISTLPVRVGNRDELSKC